MPLTLYYHPLSSYCHKVLIALYEHNVQFVPRMINLGDAAERAELQQHWPLCKFPVIHDAQRGRDVAESSVIIEYLDNHFCGAQRLVPTDIDTALQVRLWDRVFDNYAQGPQQQIVNDRIFNYQRDLSRERDLLATAYQMIDRQLQGRTWIASEHFSLADCAATPALFYASTLVPIPGACVNLLAYFERLLTRPSVQRVLQEAKPYLHMYPFIEAVPARFQ
jgi:glutathione S-transferase